MSVLVINCGSSSVKYQLIDTEDQAALVKGQIERIGSSDVADHATALEMVATEVQRALRESDSTLTAVGHRVVHGGVRYQTPVLITDDVIDAIVDLSVLAPLHNPANVEGIRAAQRAFPDLPQVAVFDTAFHSTIPAAHRSYAVPRDWETEHGVRRYGFHGTSHAYVSRRANEWLVANRNVEPDDAKVVVLHLGNGASASAVLGGRCVDTSMGLTPLPGLVMGTRSGDVDPAVFGHMHRVGGLSLDEIEAALNRSSGMLGLCDEADMRAVEQRAEDGDEQAEAALAIYVHRIRSTVGAYAAVLGGLHAVVFTAGIGENSDGVRRRVVESLGAFDLVLDSSANAGLSDDEVAVISVPASRVAALVIATDEEGEIARQTLAVVNG